MRTYGKIIMASSLAFTVAAAGMPAEAMPTYQFLNKEKYTDNGIFGALQISLRTEALRSLDAGQNDRAACILNNFATHAGSNPSEFDALIDDITAPGHLEKPIEVAILDYVNKVCGASNLAHTEMTPVSCLTAKDFFARYTVPLDKQLIIVATVSTQIARLTLSGNQDYVQCLITNFAVDENTKAFPVGFSATVRKMVENKAASSDEPVERTILNAITDQCGAEPTPN